MPDVAQLVESRLAHGGPVFLSTQPADRGVRRLAFAAVLASAAIFAAAVPFAQVPLAQVWAFIPIYESAIVINDSITAVLLFGQFRILRSHALLVLASGYLFTAFIAVSHALTFPGLFSATGLLGAGPQSTAWLYMFWHGGFPLVVVAYAFLKDKGRRLPTASGSTGIAILSSVAVVLVVCGLTLLATAGQDFLPAIMRGNHYTTAMLAVVASVWFLSLLAIVVLWLRRPHSVLDLWLMVVMCAWVFDIALAAVLNAGRFDLGFYAGRIYGLAAASFVLLVLLLENGVLHSRLAEAHEAERRERELAQRGTTELLAANRELKETQAQLRAIVETANDAIISADQRGRIVYFNHGAERAFGYTTEETIGLPLTALMPERFHEAHRAGFQRFLSTRQPSVIGRTVELAARNRNGGEFPVEFSIANWTTAEGTFFTAILRDITDRKKAEEALTAANKELEGFSYSVSHDLRSPLRAIDGFSRMLEEDYADRIDSEGRRLIGVVRDNARKMNQLIDDLLAFSRLGRKPIAVSEIDMGQQARVAFDEIRNGGSPVRLELDALPRAWGDPALVRQVWLNLLSNAIKFSAKRQEPLITVTGRKDEAESIYCVKDNGAGFDMQYYDKLFGVFQRLHSPEEFPGTGVGLAIVQRVVTRHGGRVWAEGEEGKGAAFYFTLPRRTPDD